MSVLDRLLRIARAEAQSIARKARELGQRKEGAGDEPEADAAEAGPADAPPTSHERRPPEPGRRERHTPGQDPVLAGHYAVLKLPYGADLDAVKHAYRKAMRDYHPDRHAADERRARAATEVAQHLTEAYQALRDHLESGR